MNRRAFWTGVVAALVAMAVVSLFQRHSGFQSSPPRLASAPSPTALQTFPAALPPPPSVPIASPIPGRQYTPPPGAPAQPISTPLPEGQPPPSQASAGAQPQSLPPPIAVQAMKDAVQKFGSMFNGNPVGTNAEITRALNGDNPGHARFLDGIPGQQINSNGQLVDPWGTPYFFHQLSGSDMEVRSAGPDRIMWTSDDIVIH